VLSNEKKRARYD
jgi:DnaJ homolog subfamily C member 9